MTKYEREAAINQTADVAFANLKLHAQARSLFDRLHPDERRKALEVMRALVRQSATVCA